jgi:hypothetical protein
MYKCWTVAWSPPSNVLGLDLLKYELQQCVVDSPSELSRYLFDPFIRFVVDNVMDNLSYLIKYIDT